MGMNIGKEVPRSGINDWKRESLANPACFDSTGYTGRSCRSFGSFCETRMRGPG
jgi:hypothetical protein